jgi:hypothetical protein
MRHVERRRVTALNNGSRLPWRASWLAGHQNYNSYSWAQPASSDEDGAHTTGLSIACIALAFSHFRSAW